MPNYSRESIISFLKRDKIRHLNMLYFMENNPVHSLNRMGDSVIMRGKSDLDWVFISSPNEQELTSVAAAHLTQDDKCFAVIEDWMLPLLTKNKNIAWTLTTMRLFLPDNVTFDKNPNIHAAPLSENDAPYIYKNSKYQDFTSPEYIRESIRKGVSAGIYDSGRLAAWTMTHDDLAIGFLHVLKDYRRRGYAEVLTISMIQQLREQGKMPFVHIEETNPKSMQLALKLGFKEDRRVHWFEIE